MGCASLLADEIGFLDHDLPIKSYKMSLCHENCVDLCDTDIKYICIILCILGHNLKYMSHWRSWLKMFERYCFTQREY